MRSCVVVRRLSIVVCKSHGRVHRSRLSRVLRRGVGISQTLLCRCIRKHQGRDPIRDRVRMADRSVRDADTFRDLCGFA